MFIGVIISELSHKLPDTTTKHLMPSQAQTSQQEMSKRGQR